MKRADIGQRKASPALHGETSHAKFAAALQSAADQRFQGLHDVPQFDNRPPLGGRDQAVTFTYLAWSPLLSRTCFSHSLDRAYVDWTIADLERNGRGSSLAADRAETLKAALLNEDWDTLAGPVVDFVFGPAIAQQRTRMASADLLGLIRHGMLRDLEPYRMMIDRMLARRLLDAGVDCVHVAGELHRAPNRLQASYEASTIHREVGGRMFFASHIEVGPPVVSSWLDFGDFQYNGTMIVLHEALPETSTILAPGRRLGDLVDTGVPDLNQRRISSVRIRDEGEPTTDETDWHTHVVLEPDLTPVGSAT